MKEHHSTLILPYLLLGSALTALTLIFPQIGIFEWLTMVPLMIGVYRLCADDSCTLRRAFGHGFLTIYVFNFIIYHWFVHLYPLDFVGMDKASSAIVVAVAWLGLPVLQALVGGAVFWCFRLLQKSGLFKCMPLLRPFVFAALWVAFEWSSSLTWAGVPWGRLPLGQVELLPILQTSSLFGTYFVTFLIVLVNGLIAYALFEVRRSWICCAVAGILFFGNLGAGFFLQNQTEKNNGITIKAAVVQGNIDSHEKWSADANQMTMEIYGRLTREAVAAGAELVVWPESVFPSELNHKPAVREFVSALAEECDITLVFGAFYGGEGDEYYNALFMVDPDGGIHEEYYTKRHLVPFGEYVPMRELIMTLVPPLAELSALDNDVTPGNEAVVFDGKFGKVGSLVCFDSIYESLTRSSVQNGAELMIISSNDNWFYDSAAVYQHQAQAQLRAIESGRYFVRSASTGISTIIAPDGEQLTFVDPLTEGVGLADVSIRQENTLYTRIGNLFVYLCLGFIGIAFVIGAVGYWSLRRRK